MMKTSLILAALSSLLIGCGGPTSLSKNASLFFDPAGFKVVPTKADAVMTQRQVLPSFQKCLGLTDAQVTTRTRNAIAESTTSFSLDGSAGSVTGPMMMAFVKVGGEFCQDIIETEKNSSARKYFLGFNLGGTANAQAFNMNATIQKFANNCWGRAATVDETNIVTTAVTSANLYSGAQASAVTGTALFVCTTMLSSSQAIRR